MLSDARNNNSCALRPRLFHHYLAHNLRIAIIKMADWFVCKKEIKRLRKSPYHCHTLLLTEGHLPYLHIYFVGNTKTLKHIKNLSTGLPA